LTSGTRSGTPTISDNVTSPTTGRSAIDAPVGNRGAIQPAAISNKVTATGSGSSGSVAAAAAVKPPLPSLDTSLLSPLSRYRSSSDSEPLSTRPRYTPASSLCDGHTPCFVMISIIYMCVLMVQ
jgi:hypothetical protein